jgi:hypothetical protein
VNYETLAVRKSDNTVICIRVKGADVEALMNALYRSGDFKPFITTEKIGSRAVVCCLDNGRLIGNFPTR